MYSSPVIPGISSQSKSEWSSGLCSCMEDFSNCCYGAFCSGCTTINTMKIVNGQFPNCCDNFFGTALSVISMYWIGILCHGFVHMRTRQQFIEKFNIQDDHTCLRSFCCLWCSACQIEREIDNRRKLGSIPQPPSMA